MSVEANTLGRPQNCVVCVYHANSRVRLPRNYACMEFCASQASRRCLQQVLSFFRMSGQAHEYFSEEVPASISLPLFQVEPRASLTYDNTLSNQAMYPMFARLKPRMGKVQITRLNSKISPELEGVDACYSRHGPACYSHLFFKYSIKFVSSSFLENILDNR